jgi:hypothetical protein
MCLRASTARHVALKHRRENCESTRDCFDRLGNVLPHLGRHLRSPGHLNCPANPAQGSQGHCDRHPHTATNLHCHADPDCHTGPQRHTYPILDANSHPDAAADEHAAPQPYSHRDATTNFYRYQHSGPTTLTTGDSHRHHQADPEADSEANQYTCSPADKHAAAPLHWQRRDGLSQLQLDWGRGECDTCQQRSLW